MIKVMGIVNVTPDSFSDGGRYFRPEEAIRGILDSGGVPVLAHPAYGDGDQLILNPAVLEPRFTRSGYSAVWTDGETEEWLMQAEDGIVTSCSRTGGKGGWQLYSVSRWTKEDGKKLRRHLEQESEGGNRQIYWDDVAMFCHPEDFELGVYPMQKDDVKEIDSFAELVQLDPAYAKEEPKQ